VLGKVLESLYNKVLINIIVKRSSCEVFVEVCSKKGTKEEVHHTFETTTLNEKMISFITEYIKESPYYYISILDTSSKQGAIPTCKKNQLDSYTDLSFSEYKCYKSEWIYYTLKADIYSIEKDFQKIGVDFIFSPFLLLRHFFKDKINSKLAMYILIEDSALFLAIFEMDQLLFAQRLGVNFVEEVDDELLSHNINEENEMSMGDDISIDLEDIDVIDEIESLEDFGDIEDLDSLEDIDEFSEDEDLEEELPSVEESPQEEKQTTFNEDYQRFSLIQASLGHFYNDDKYESKFIENVYIADAIGVSPDLKRYLEEEMFLNVYVRELNLSRELSKVAKVELGL